MNDPEAPLRALHEQFCKWTGRNLTFGLHQRDWYEFSKVFTESDLNTVMAYVQSENTKRDRQYRIRVDLHKLIGDLGRFDELKAEAEQHDKAKAAKARAFKPSAGQQALAEMRHEEVASPQTEPKMAKELVLKGLAELQEKLKNE